jgi:hypothetical protein
LPVLLEGISVVVRLEAIQERYAGFWPRFVAEVPNRTICTDGEIASVGFMDTRDAVAFVKALAERGLVPERDGLAIDCATVEQESGPDLPCPWLEIARAEFEGETVVVGRLVSGKSTRTVARENWSPQRSLSRTGGKMLTSEFLKHFEFVRHEGPVDAFRNRATGQIVYVGRTSDSGRGWFARHWAVWRSGCRDLTARMTARWNATARAKETLRLHEDAAKRCRRDAEQGEAEAQYQLATMFTAGRGVPQDHEEAARWYRGAAEQGHPRALFTLGVMYMEGQGLSKDPSEAISCFHRGAVAGGVEAQVELGLMFYSARGVPQDYVAAANWFHRAAEQGDAFAQHSLATQYRMGQGVPQNSATAVDWYRRAAEQGHADAQFDLGVCYVEGNGVSVDMLEAYIWFDLAARHYPPGKDRQDALTARQDTSRNLTRAQRATAKRRAGERSSKGA